MSASQVTQTDVAPSSKKIGAYQSAAAAVPVEFSDFREPKTSNVAVKLLWSDTELKLLYTVVDDKVVAPSTMASGGAWFKDDAAEFFIVGHTQAYHQHVIVSASGLATLLTDENDIIADQTGFTGKSSVNDNGYSVNVTMTWKLLGYDNIADVRASPPRIQLGAVDNDGDTYLFFDAERFVEFGLGWGFVKSDWTQWPSIELRNDASAASTTQLLTSSPPGTTTTSDGAGASTTTGDSTQTLSLYPPQHDCDGGLLCECSTKNTCKSPTHA